MPKSSWIRWSIRAVWLVAVVVVYRSLVDFGPQGSGSHALHMIVMFVIFAAGDLALERWGARRSSLPTTPPRNSDRAEGTTRGRDDSRYDPSR